MPILLWDADSFLYLLRSNLDLYVRVALFAVAFDISFV